MHASPSKHNNHNIKYMNDILLPALALLFVHGPKIQIVTSIERQSLTHAHTFARLLALFVLSLINLRFYMLQTTINWIGWFLNCATPPLHHQAWVSDVWVFYIMKLPWKKPDVKNTRETKRATLNPNERNEKRKILSKTNKLRIIHKMLIEYVIHSGLATCRQSTLRRFQTESLEFYYYFLLLLLLSFKQTVGIYCRQSLHISNTRAHKYQQSAK